jgi:hypothetical protein
MIALACFIVVAQHAFALYHVGQGILVFMTACRHRSRHAPDTQLNERFAIELVPFAQQQFGSHCWK